MSIYPVSINNLTKSFNNIKVLDDVNINISEGKIFGLIGRNGQGKTTIIKILLDLISADSGEVLFFGNSNRNMNYRKLISYLPEKFIPSIYLKGNEFLKISLSFYKKKYNEEKVLEMMDKVGLDRKFLNVMIKKYSKGMAQKIGLISSFLTEAPIIILDEPMSGLDPIARIQIKRLMKEYRDAGNTIIFTSHILADIDEICDDIAILENNKIKFHGIPEQFRKNSNNLEEAFIEMIN